jgi:hypothetical protein
MAYMKKNQTGIVNSSVNWAKVFAAIGAVTKVIFTLCLVVVCLAFKGLAKLMKLK